MARKNDVNDAKWWHCLQRSGTWCLLVLLAACLTACGPGPADTPPQTKTVRPKRARKPKKQPVQPAADNDTFAYDASGKPDPFMPLVIEDDAKKKTARMPRVSKPLTPLQRFALTDLQLVAIISSGDRSAALLQDPTGFGYIVNEGTLVGKNDGVIVKILDNGIIIQETIYNAVGEPESRTSTLKIERNK